MNTIIFCPNCHRLVGLDEKCKHCNWVRPAQPSLLGQITWEAGLGAPDPLPGMPPFPARITSGAGLIFVPTETGELVALEAETGSIKWQRLFRADHKLRTTGVALWKDTVLVGAEHLADLPTRDRALMAWLAATGEDAWNWPTSGDSLSIPLVHRDTVYFTSSEPRLYALDLEARQLCWSVPSLTWSPDSPAVGGDIIVVPSRGPTVAAYSASDGTRVWTFEADDKEMEWLHQRPAISAETAFLAGWDRRLYAIDLATGALRWRFQAERGITCSPVLAGDKLLLGVKDYRTGTGERKPGYGLYAIDIATGETAWHVHTDKHIHISPAVADNLVLCGADDRRLRALDIHDGHQVWQVALPEKLRAGPHVVGDHVIVGQRNGTLVSIRWKVTPPARPDPNELLTQGRPLEAAVELALLGQYEAAGRLFAEHGELEHAAALYLEAQQWSEAAIIYEQCGEWDQALNLYRQAGNRRGEADVLVLQRNHAEAAPIYEALGELDLAVREYIAADRAGYAAQLLRKVGRRQAAAKLYQSLNQDDQAAEILVEDGRHAEAAQVYQSLGRHEVAAGVLAQGGLLAKAAALYEQLGRTQLAADLYAQAGQTDQAMGLYDQLQDWKHVAELAKAADNLPRLANALLRLGQTAQAAQICERGGMLEQALNLYQELSQWDKVEQIAGQLERWEQQASALMQIGLVSEAGEAYERAAAQMQTRSALPEELGRLYELAATCFAQDEDARRQQICWDKVCQYRQWPNLRGRFEFSGPFYQNEFNQINLVVQNVGYGVARSVMVKKVGAKFQLDMSESETTSVTRLAQQQDRTIPLSLRPKPDVLGRVMLRVTLSYQTRSGQEHEQEFAQTVEVLGRDEKIAAIRQQTPPGGITPPPAMYTPEEKAAEGDVDLVKLRDGLAAHFNEDELRDLCFELGMDYEDLPGEGKTAKARELVAYHERRGLVRKLAERCYQLRPNVSW